MRIKLTERSLAGITLPPDKAQLVVWDADLTGFGVVVGKSARTFIVDARVNGAKRRKAIGIAGRVREDGHHWTVQLGRQRAKEILGQMAAGIDPHAERRARLGGPTLREALDFHIGKMERGENRRGKVCSPRSIQTIRQGVTKHFAAWLDRPLMELDTDALEGVLRHVEANTPRRSDSNPANPPGRALANHLLAFIGAIWRSYHRRYGLPVANPAERLIPGALDSRTTRIPDDGFAAWHAKVTAMTNPIRRDLQLVGLFTGLRSESLRTLRWEDVDFQSDMIQIERAKGDRPFTLPLTRTVREVLKRRQRENAVQFGPHGGDHGFVFPSLTRERPLRVIAVAEVKERELDPKSGKRVKSLLGIHASRRTFNSVAIEIGIPLEAREALLNHAGRGVNVRSYGRPQNWDHLRGCAEQIEAALWQRIRGKRRSSGRRTRRA